MISGTAPATAGVYSFTISASTALGTSRATFTLRVVSSAEQAAVPLSVVINKYQNTTTDRIELLVVGDNSDSASGPKVNLQGMILKDFNSNMATDGGGKYVFTNHALWASVKAGTLIVLSGETAALKTWTHLILFSASTLETPITLRSPVQILTSEPPTWS